MNVFILEDKWIEQRYLEQTLRKIQAELKIFEMNILSFTDASSLTAQLPKPNVNNVFLLDIEIAGNKKAGLQVSQQIRQHDAFATIIFVTVHDEFLATTYKFKSEALDFIAKDQDNIAAKLKDDFLFITKKLQHQRPVQWLTLKTNAGYLKEDLNTIYYFEPSPTNSHQSLLHTTDNQVLTINATLNELETEFSVLFRSHRHYLINPLKVVSVNLKHHTLRFKGDKQDYPFSRLQTRLLFARLKSLESPLKII